MCLGRVEAVSVDCFYHPQTVPLPVHRPPAQSEQLPDADAANTHQQYHCTIWLWQGVHEALQLLLAGQRWQSPHRLWRQLRPPGGILLSVAVLHGCRKHGAQNGTDVLDTVVRQPTGYLLVDQRLNIFAGDLDQLPVADCGKHVPVEHDRVPMLRGRLSH